MKYEGRPTFVTTDNKFGCFLSPEANGSPLSTDHNTLLLFGNHSLELWGLSPRILYLPKLDNYPELSYLPHPCTFVYPPLIFSLMHLFDEYLGAFFWPCKGVTMETKMAMAPVHVKLCLSWDRKTLDNSTSNHELWAVCRRSWYNNTKFK